MADARPNIPTAPTTAPIRIDARIIVFLYSGPAVPEPPAHRGSKPNELSPDGYTGALHDRVLAPARDEGSALEPLA